MSKDIKKALEHCIEWDCVDCPNREELGSGETVCRGRLLTDVLEYVADLEVKLAERTKQLKIALKDFNDIQQESDKLAQQLSEKDELLKQKIGDMKSTDFIRICKECGFIIQAKEIDNQTAIAELEKLRKQLDCEDNYCYGDNNIVICINRTIFNNIIDQRIKLLKGENK